jgi:hypothetical protein
MVGRCAPLQYGVMGASAGQTFRPEVAEDMA